MKIYVLGAGASKGSQLDQVDPFRRAPLADELFSEVYREHADYVGLNPRDLNRIADGSKRDGVETWLTNEWKAAEQLRDETAKRAKKVLFGRLIFYLWKLFLDVSQTYRRGDKNGYTIFADKLAERAEPFGLISFNYDLLLDRAVQYRFGWTLRSLQDYQHVNFIKPHGSVNWFLSRREGEPDVTSEGQIEVGPTDAQYRIGLASSLLFTAATTTAIQNLRIMPPDLWALADPVHCFDRMGQYFYPMMVMPLTGKQYDWIAEFSERIINRAKDMLAVAKEVYLIGYRANDEIIKEMFQTIKSGTQLHVVGMSDAEEIAERVLRWGMKLEKNTIYSEGFMDFVEKGL